MPRVTIIYWRDIPSQVIAEEGRGRNRKQAKVELPKRFLQAVDAAAMAGGATDSDAYLAEWRKGEAVACGDDLQAEAEAVADRLIADYPASRLGELAKQGGYATDKQAADADTV